MNLRTVRGTVALGVAAMLAISVAGWLLLVGPTSGKVSQTRTDIADTVAANQTLAARLTDLRAQAEDLSVTRSAAAELERLWPGTADQPGFFRAVNVAAQDAGYLSDQITALSPSAPVTVDEAGQPVGASDATAAFAVQTVSMSVEGTLDQAQRFLDGLEMLPRALLVQRVAVTPVEDGTASLTVTGSTYVASPLAAPRRVTRVQQAAEPAAADGAAAAAAPAP